MIPLQQELCWVHLYLHHLTDLLQQPSKMCARPLCSRGETEAQRGEGAAFASEAREGQSPGSHPGRLTLNGVPFPRVLTAT